MFKFNFVILITHNVFDFFFVPTWFMYFILYKIFLEIYKVLQRGSLIYVNLKLTISSYYYLIHDVVIKVLCFTWCEGEFLCLELVCPSKRFHT